MRSVVSSGTRPVIGRIFFTLLLVFNISHFCLAQTQRQISMTEYSGRHSYDIVEYKLFMDWYNAISGSSSSFSGVMQIKFLPDLTSPVNSISLDNNPKYLSVDSAFANGQRLALAPAPDVPSHTDGMLGVSLDKNYFAGDTAVVTLHYHVKEQPADSQKGFYYYYAGEQLAGNYTVPHTLAYTMSEPSDAHDWMPCYDDPSDKALCQISIRVPNGYTAASNGTLQSKVDNQDGSTTFNWSENYPISTYLMCATTARFSIVQRNYTKNDDSTIPIQYYVYPEDSTGALTSTDCNIDTVASMVKFYESLYGTFPFDKYGMTGIEPFNYGGMEHQTITTLLRKYEYSRRVVAHELAHQWWGDMVTVGTWNDIWLNESFATYSEAMQLQHLSQSEFENEMNFYEGEFFSEDSSKRYAIYAPPPGYIFGLAEYYKGAWVLHMLRNIVGDSTFFQIFKTYRTQFQFGNAVTADFENVVNQVTHNDMSWFFNEWIFQPGYPVYSFTYNKEGDSLMFNLNQRQANAPVFKMPVEFAVYSQGQKTMESFVDSSASQTFTISFQLQPDSVIFDPDDEILKQVVSSNSLGIIGTHPIEFKVFNSYPNPFNPTATIVYQLPSISDVVLDVYDVLGRKIATLVNGMQTPGTYKVTFDGHDLASGVYFCRMTTGFGHQTLKLLLEK
jgi:aminopeptidase N